MLLLLPGCTGDGELDGPTPGGRGNSGPPAPDASDQWQGARLVDSGPTHDLVVTLVETLQEVVPSPVDVGKGPEITGPEVHQYGPEVDCDPQCGGYECGDDGCGGVCGVCGGGYACYGGKCGNCSAAFECDDDNECTDQKCKDNQCVFVANESSCDDQDECTKDDICADKECWGDEIDCDDGNDCTVDDCDSDIGCQHAKLSGVDCESGFGGCIDGLCVAKKPVCPDGWGLGSYEPARCYRPFAEEDEELAFADAESLCNQFPEGHLVTIHSDEEQEQAKLLINESNFTDDTTWIGFHDLKEEGEFEWTDGTAVVYTAWADGEPDNSSGCWFGECPANCVAIEDPLFGFGAWRDMDCEEEHRFICMMPAVWVMP